MIQPATTRALCALALPFLLAGTVAAQGGPASSASYVALSDSLVSTGGQGSSLSFSGQEVLHPSLGGADSQSASYTAQGGIVWLEPVAPGAGPVVLSVSPPLGDAVGGEPVSVVGLHFAAPGAGNTDVFFGGSPGAQVSVANDTRIDVVTPSGTNPHGNPLGAVDVEVVNDLGAGVLADGFTYLPALKLTAPVAVGGSLDLEHVGLPGSTWIVAAGAPVPGLSVPIAPYDGALELVIATQALSPFLHVDGQGFGSFHLPVPNIPTLAGSIFHVQALSIASFAPLSGGFTNSLVFQVQQ